VIQRREIKEDVQAEARVLPENMAASITFERPDELDGMLAVLQIRPHVRHACVYNLKGELFGRFARDGEPGCPAAPPPRNAFGWNTYDVVADITYDGEKAGVFYLSRDLRDVHRRLVIGGTTIVGLLLLAVAAALALAHRMQRSISEPLLDLADTARRVSASRDYSIRVNPLASDEIGIVVRAFNEMLDHIAVRTAELSKANTELQREVDERKRVERDRVAALEREREANRLKDEFLATLSHELRTPMNAVLGWARVLRSTSADETTRERGLASIERNARTQARLIEDLLEISRIVTGKLRLQIREVDLAAVVDTAVDNVKPAALAKRLRLTVHIDVRPALTQGDPDRLQQVIWNLLSNAVKFTPPDGAVMVELSRKDGYVLTVQDSGPGIEPKFLPHVFDAFRQADGSATREHGGLGLGLAIARQLVEAHGGTIQAQSAGTDQGRPSSVPALGRRDDRSRRLAGQTQPRRHGRCSHCWTASTSWWSMTMRTRAAAADDAEPYGAAVTTAASVGEALAVDRSRASRRVLSDIGMPHEDGYDLLRRLRARRLNRAGEFRAVAVTAYASATDRSSDAGGRLSGARRRSRSSRETSRDSCAAGASDDAAR
jgi:signal transduction histidine kinase/CheY-like chemotaxis protein